MSAAAGAAAGPDAEAPRPTLTVSRMRAHGLAALACVLTAAIAWPTSAYFDQANIVMMFLLTVVLVALRLGRAASILAAFFSVGLFDFFFVPPQLSFAVSDAQYLLTFAIMLIVALITGQLTASLRQSAHDAAIRERRTRVLYEMAREFAGALTVEQVIESAQRLAADLLGARIAILLPGADGRLSAPPGCDWVNLATASFAYDAGGCSDIDANRPAAYLPLKAPMRVRGVMAVLFADAHVATLAEHEELLETIASLIGIAVERVHYVAVANRTQVQMASERLRSSILSALSHDVRTPLTALVGLADALALSKPDIRAEQRELAQAVREQALRINAMVNKLLDMARLNAGQVKLRKEWQPLQEVVGASLKLIAGTLADRDVCINLPANLPLVEFDAVLIERVLCNLLENAAKYSPAAAPIDVSARVRDDYVDVSVCDRGSGLPRNALDIFDVFTRGERESAQPGVGLGLAICRVIVEAHGGVIAAEDRDGGGACFRFSLPAGMPPRIEPEENGS